jgi:hypothetical protein
LAQFRVGQAKGIIQFAGGIGETGKIVELVRSEKICGALFGAQVDESQGGAFGFQLRTKFAELGDRLATKGSAKVAEEDQEEWAVGRNGGDGLAGLRLICL